LLALLVVVAVDAWVYEDAKARAARGTPVVFSFGTFTIDTPGGMGDRVPVPLDHLLSALPRGPKTLNREKRKRSE